MEAQGLVYNPEGHPAVVQHTTAGLVAPDNPHYISRVDALNALESVKGCTERLVGPGSEHQSDDDRQMNRQGIERAFKLVRGHE